MTINEKIREARLERGIEVKELAKFIGVSQTTVRNWEYGRRGVSKRHASRLEKILDIQLGNVGPQIPIRVESRKSWLAQTRRSVGLTQKVLAKMLDVNDATISYYEKGRHKVPIRLVSRYAEALGVTEEEFEENVKVNTESYSFVPPPIEEPTRPWAPEHILSAGKCLEEVPCLRWLCTRCKRYFCAADPKKHKCETPS